MYFAGGQDMLYYKNLAIFGGTFNPVHFGHLLIAEQAYNFFEIDHIIFMPAGIPPHKESSHIIAPEHRLNMVRLAIKDNDNFSCSDYELNKRGKSFTVQTLKYFQQKNIAEEIFFIIGADSLVDIFNWREPSYILANSTLIVARRPGYDLKQYLQNEKYKPYRNRILIMDTFKVEYSSTVIRDYINKGHSIKYQTPDSVIEYIDHNHLYRDGSG